VLLDEAAITAKLASVGPVGLRQLVVQIGAMHFVRAIQSHAFSSSPLTFFVIPRTVEIVGSSCFSSCESLSYVSIESDSLLRRIESEAFSSTNLMSVYLLVDVQFIAVNDFSDYCQVLRK
jgi:hypothetical protein